MKIAKASNNDGAKKLELFMDSAKYKELFDDVYFDVLEIVLNQIDSFEEGQQKKISELKQELEDLEEDLEKLKQELKNYE